MLCKIVQLLLLGTTSLPNNYGLSTESTTTSKLDKLAQDLDLPVNHLPFYYSLPKLTTTAPANFNYKFDDRDKANTGTGVIAEQSTEESDLMQFSDVTSTTTDNNLTIIADQMKNPKYCWGFEQDCDFRFPGSFSYPYPICDPIDLKTIPKRYYYSDHVPSTDYEERRQIFYDQSDFGYVKTFRNTIQTICNDDGLSNDQTWSSKLECSKLFTFCRGRNILLNFKSLVNRTEEIMYDLDVLGTGDMIGRCELNRTAFTKNINFQFQSSLISWIAEMKNFKATGTLEIKEECEIVVDRPTIIMKLDATNNMYHHFCDFFNLYATLFVNSTFYPNGSVRYNAFDKDVHILLWRSWYLSNFSPAFNAFTKNRITNLKEYYGKKVCFRNVIFSLPSRMMGGLYYSTPLEPGCQGSGLFNAFSEFMMHRLKIPSTKTEFDFGNIRVTFISRQTRFRRIENENKIIEGLRKNFTNLNIKKFIFTEQVDFIKQLTVIRNTDILIGMHGAGLTHMMFLPKWAKIFEVYHCEDPNCYGELARQTGHQYFTWEKNDMIKVVEKSKDIERPEHYHKHANYEFDPEEFGRIVGKAVQYLKKEYESMPLKSETGHDEL